MVSAAFTGGVEFVTAAGVVLALAHAVERRVRARPHERVRAFLGDRVYSTRDSLTSPDGSRRVRSCIHDGLARFEVLDPSGRTLSSHRVRVGGDVVPRAEASVAGSSFFARVHGRGRAQVCFDGLPSELGGSPRCRPTLQVRLRVFDDGVLATRVGAGDKVTGDTWHDDVDAALDQLRWELGPHLGVVREGEGEPRPQPARLWE